MGWEVDLAVASIFRRAGYDQQAPPPIGALRSRLAALGEVETGRRSSRRVLSDVRLAHEAAARELATSLPSRTRRRCATSELAAALMIPRPFVERTVAEHGFVPKTIADAVLCTELFAAVRMARVVYGAPLLRCIDGGAGGAIRQQRARAR